MSDKLIDLTRLQTYKTYSDAKYQNKITAGSNINISGNVISRSGAPTYVPLPSSTVSVPNNSITEVGSVVLQPGIYVLSFTCTFTNNNTTDSYRQCGFSTNTRYLDSFGSAYWDSQRSIGSAPTQTMVTAIFEVSASSYPNGRTFYLLAKQNSGYSIDVLPRCYYLKF